MRKPIRSRRPKPRPPKRHCRDCGADVYSWTEAPLCDDCARELRDTAGRPRESLRDFRRRVIDPARDDLPDR